MSQPDHSTRLTRVLIVEDDPLVASGLRVLLSRRGCEVTVVTTVREGLMALHEATRFGCVILDLMLPDGDGRAVLEEVRRRRLGVRVVVTTAVSDPHHLDAVRRLGPDAVLRKPITFDELLDALDCT